MVWNYVDYVKGNGYFQLRRNEQAKYWMYESINETLRNSFFNNPIIEEQIVKSEQQVLNGEITSFVAAKKLLELYRNLD